MNVLIAVPWDQESGGVASVTGHLAMFLQRRGHKIIFLHHGQSDFVRHKKTKWGFDGVELNMRAPLCSERPIRSVLSFLVFLPLTFCRLFVFIRNSSIHVVNIHYPGESFVYFVILRWLCLIRLVVSVHGSDLFPGGRPKRKYSWAIRMILQAADRVVAPSKAFLADVLRIFPGLRPKGICIHNGVYFEDLRRESKRYVDAAAERYILCLAVQNEKKGVDVLIRAFASLCLSEPTLKLKLAGDGPLRKDLEKLADSLRIRDRVDFLGWQRRIEVTTLLCACEVFVMPSRSEPFGIAIIEAMACKRPVVASAIGGIPEIVQNGENGILVEPDNPTALADAIALLMNDLQLRQKIAERGYSTARRLFGFEKMGLRYESMFADSIMVS